jgi:hypothetical protein
MSIRKNKIYILSGIFCICVSQLFSQKKELKVEIQYDTLTGKGRNEIVALEFAYKFNKDNILVMLDGKQIINESLSSDDMTDFSKEFKIVCDKKQNTFPFNIQIGKYKSKNILLIHTNYYYFFYDKKHKYLKIRATNELLITG